jgi:hypothetical protein
MQQPNDQYEPINDEAMAVPVSWSPAPVPSMAMAADCACPADCPRDHENE